MTLIRDDHRLASIPRGPKIFKYKLLSFTFEGELRLDSNGISGELKSLKFPDPTLRIYNTLLTNKWKLEFNLRIENRNETYIASKYSIIQVKVHEFNYTSFTIRLIEITKQ